MIRRLLAQLLITLTLIPCILFSVMWIEYGLPEFGAFVYDSDLGSSSVEVFSLGGQFTAWITSAHLSFADDDFTWHPFPRVFLGTVGGDVRTGSIEFGSPLWVLALATSPPLVWALFAAFRASLRQRRLRRGHCGKCGYDLRASDGRCSECGMPVPVKAA
jgi:hypothetical protein